MQELQPCLNIKVLLRYDQSWLSFLVQHRIYGEPDTFDIVYDRMADSYYPVLAGALAEYAYGNASPETVLRQIAFSPEGRRDQYCFKTERAIRTLKRVEAQRYVYNGKTGWQPEPEPGGGAR